MIEARLQRRTSLQGSVAGAATGFLGGGTVPGVPSPAHATPGSVPGSRFARVPAALWLGRSNVERLLLIAAVLLS